MMGEASSPTSASDPAEDHLATRRFRLRLMTAARDAALFQGLFGDPAVMRWIGPPLALDECVSALGRISRHNAMAAPGHRYWAIEDRSTGDGVGMVALVRSGVAAEFGIMLRPRWWRTGVGSEVVPALLDHGFGAMELAGVTVQRADDAQAEIMHRLLRKFGFERVGAVPAQDETPTRCHWALARARWREWPRTWGG